MLGRCKSQPFYCSCCIDLKWNDWDFIWCIAGYFGGLADNIMMRFCELIASIPQMLWVILLILILKPGVGPVIIAIAATGWIGMARLFRGQVFQIKEMEFVMGEPDNGGGQHLDYCQTSISKCVKPDYH